MNRHKFILCAFLFALLTSCTPSEAFKFQVTILPQDRGLFFIPLSGQLDSVWNKPYHWKINWGDGTKQTVSNLDLDAPQNEAQSRGIFKKYKITGNFTITITPAGSTDAWLSAFGFYTNLDGANARKNKDKVTQIISPLTPLMTRTHAQIDANEAPDNEWRDAFNGCSRLTMDEGFSFSEDWNKITFAGHHFARGMFNGCGRTTFKMSEKFNLPEGLTQVGDGFARDMFANCSGDFFTMNDLFNLPAGIINAGDGFACKLFYNCYGAKFAMNQRFNLPAGITNARHDFAYGMFSGCVGDAFTMNSVFNLPSEMTTVDDNFANGMFFSCSGSTFTMNDVFNLPSGITTLRHNFASAMFAYCNGAAFTMNDVFNLPQKITTVGHHFASELFAVCSGSAFTMNQRLTLPEGITTVGDHFASAMFFQCRGPAFTMNSVFNLPQKITTVGKGFANRMFAYCSGAGFIVNRVFVFPVLSKRDLDKTDVYFRTFFYMGANSIQKRTAASIIGHNPTPNMHKETFSDSGCFFMHPSVHRHWGNDNY